MKKLFTAASAAILCFAMLTGCSGTKENTVHSADDLKNKTIGVQLGTTGDTLANDIEGATVERYKRGADAIQALKQGKIDAVIIDNEPAKVFIEKNEGLQILTEEFAVEEYAIALKKGNTELTQAINDALAELKSDGTLANIEKNWIGEEYGKYPYTSPEGTEYPNGTLIMATNAEFPPYEFLDNQAIVGFDVDMMTAVCDKLGYELEIENIAFDSIIASINSSKADVGVAGMSVTEDRLKNVDFTDAYTTSTQVIITRAD
ncbi:MAG: transporter substrate-binding domain-containing protein [Ruminococcus sp.]|nr:transporter substrate-binding domain-containing protein [Ruminococcus sp.]